MYQIVVKVMICMILVEGHPSRYVSQYVQTVGLHSLLNCDYRIAQRGTDVPVGGREGQENRQEEG